MDYLKYTFKVFFGQSKREVNRGTMLKGEEDKIMEYDTTNGATTKLGCSLFLRKKTADNPADYHKIR